MAERIVPRVGETRVRTAQVITASNVRHAYGFRESRYQQKRINTWAKLSRQLLGDLGARIVKRSVKR